ncbi:hypothetical protein [Cellulomonas sp. ATA003]|uniref:ATP-dependent DNA ligase n=1 Tax=Cellulomonas sp. ATA003 TaxID=3073064 RepID=UPI002872F613|nr:hypothetical protein [Cellulomonas sp. ATA003]WNB85157.1 hypothetical protein REH70_16155 [Cellulomonas sp. ATA003]
MDLIAPMLATPSSSASNRRPIAIGDVCGRPDWLAQEKVDGIRARLYSQDGKVRLVSRSGRNMAAWFPEVEGLRRLPNMVLDGGLMARDGVSSTVATREKQIRNGARRRQPVLLRGVRRLAGGR